MDNFRAPASALQFPVFPLAFEAVEQPKPKSVNASILRLNRANSHLLLKSPFMTTLFRRCLLAVAILLSQNSVFAGTPAFSVTIAGYHQTPEFTDEPPKQVNGFPAMTIPSQPGPELGSPLDDASYGSDQPTGNHFYVVIRNISSEPITIERAISSWYDCLQFELTGSDGKTFSIHRHPIDVMLRNPMYAWMFQPGGIRVFTVDFTSGPWEGFPSEADLPRSKPFKIKATFTYYVLEGSKVKEIKCESGTIAAIDARVPY